MKLSKELTGLVRDSDSLLGVIIRRELGLSAYERIEELREQMVHMRNRSLDQQVIILRENFQKLERLSQRDLHAVASSFTLMLELMNACENAYRSHRLMLKQHPKLDDGKMPAAIVYVLTAHPTEARAPQNIAIFHQIQQILLQALGEHSNEKQDFHLSQSCEIAVVHALEIAWRTNIVRTRSPKVKDEADHIYSLLFRDNVILSLLDQSRHPVPFFVRSWVGGDKDGHPGVNERTLLESLSLSRNQLLRVFREEMGEIRKTLGLFKRTSLQRNISRVEKRISRLKQIQTGDGSNVFLFKKEFDVFRLEYIRLIGAPDIALGVLALHRVALPVLVREKLEGTSDSAARPLKPLVHDVRPARALVDREVVGDDGGAPSLPVLQLDLDGARCAARSQLLGSATTIPRVTKSVLKALGEEVEHVEDRRLAAAVGAEQHGERGKLGEVNVPQRAEVLHA